MGLFAFVAWRQGPAFIIEIVSEAGYAGGAKKTGNKELLERTIMQTLLTRSQSITMIWVLLCFQFE